MTTFDGFTELENKLLNGIKNTWWCFGCNCTYLDEAADDAGLTMKEARGIISSLIKKGIVLECLPEFQHEISLTKKGEELLEIEE
jgi:hypothetical protein